MTSEQSAPVKRRKKRKPKQGHQATHGEETSPPTQPGKQESNLRFSDALDKLQQNSVDSQWTKLDSCNIFDGKTKKIAKALLHNKEIISLDLSNNHISQAGLEALAESLHQGGAPELILLNLQGNGLVEESQIIIEKLGNSRKELKIQLKEEDPWESTQLTKASKTWLIDEPEPKSELAQPSMPDPSPVANSFWQRFFQIGNGGGLFGSRDSQTLEVAEAAGRAEELWIQVNEELNKEEVQITELAKHLYSFALGLKIEMETCAVPFLTNTKLDELRPFAKQAVQGLECLQSALAILAAPLLTTFSKTTPVGGVGSHVLLVAQIVERLCYARTGVINIHLVKAGLVPQLMALGFKYSVCSPLQSTCCQIMRWMIASNLRLLWEPLLKPCMGNASQAESPQGSNIISLICQILETASHVESVAKRPCETGFALHIACQLYYESSKVDALRTSLLACPEWHALVADGSTFHRLRVEQEGELCGPKPSRLLSPSTPVIASDEVERSALESAQSSQGSEQEKLVSQNRAFAQIQNTETASDIV